MPRYLTVLSIIIDLNAEVSDGAFDLSVAQQELHGSEVTRPSNSNRVLIDQTCFGRSGGLAPISLPLFQGVRLVAGEQFSSSGMVVLLCY
jgi:hypothetical protein